LSAANFLFDTTIWIELGRGIASDELRRRAKELISERVAATNEVVTLEVLVGSRNRADYRANTAQLRSLLQFPVHDATWRRASDLGFELRRNGFTPSVPDLLIATSAIEQGATLVHADRDFDAISRLSPLTVESYASPAL
jgi:predicted nucleic acid-binding protein